MVVLHFIETYSKAIDLSSVIGIQILTIFKTSAALPLSLIFIK